MSNQTGHQKVVVLLEMTYAFFFGPGWSALSPIRRFVEVEAEGEGASFSLSILVAMELNKEVNNIKINR